MEGKKENEGKPMIIRGSRDAVWKINEVFRRWFNIDEARDI